MYKQEAQGNTDSYLQNSKLMEGDSDDEDENASGILKHRPRLWTELSSKFSNKRWWENMEQLQTKATLLSALKAMHADDRLGATSKYRGSEATEIYRAKRGPSANEYNPNPHH